jgi:hypothetical protein
MAEKKARDTVRSAQHELAVFRQTIKLTAFESYVAWPLCSLQRVAHPSKMVAP